MNAATMTGVEIEHARRERLSEQIDNTRIALIAWGHPDDELLARLAAARDSARNPSLKAPKPQLPIALRLLDRALKLEALSPAARVLEEKAIAREYAELTKS